VDRHTLSDGKQKEWEKKRGKYTQTAAGMKRQCFLPHKNMCYIKRQFSWIIHRKLVTTLYYNVIFPWKHEQAETHLLLWPSWWTWQLDVIVAFWRLTMTIDIELYLIQRAIGDVIGVNARACPPASPAAGWIRTLFSTLISFHTRTNNNWRPFSESQGVFIPRETFHLFLAAVLFSEHQGSDHGRSHSSFQQHHAASSSPCRGYYYYY
jgi:hypothetical protein